MKRFFNKIHGIRYQKRRIVLVVDLLLSLLATLFTLLLLFSFTGRTSYYPHGMVLLSLSGCATLLFCLLFGLNKEVIRHFSLRGISKIGQICLLKSVVLFFYLCPFTDLSLLTVSLFLLSDLLFSLFFLCGMRVAMVATYYALIEYSKSNTCNTLIYSTQDTSILLATQIRNNPKMPYKVKGFLTTNAQKVGFRIIGLPVYGVQAADLSSILTEKKIRNIIFPSQERLHAERDRLVRYALDHEIALFVMGNMSEVDGQPQPLERQIKPISIEDLLNRDEIKIDIDLIAHKLTDEVVLVTGAAGSIGSEIVNQVAQFGIKQLILYDAAETALHDQRIKLSKLYPTLDIHYILGDVRSGYRIRGIFEKYRPTIVFHAAAYKHVPLVEDNPCEGVLTNILGTINVAKQAIAIGVKKFVMISTDKAVNPTNVMGASKRIAEMCVQALNGQHETEFITTRFGNVLGSNGSVIPHFRRQIEAGGPVTVTHPEIIRYFMTIPEACRLVLQASVIGRAGDILVFDMGEQVKIVDLARKMIILSGFTPDKEIKITFTGLRPGEKLYEELLTSNEGTSATSHEKIRIAQCTPLNHSQVKELVDELIELALAVDIEGTVKLMKRICPEFVSNNSRFEAFDK